MKRIVWATCVAVLMALPALAEDRMQPTAGKAAAAKPAMETAAPAPTGGVARASFTTGVMDREPIDSVSSLTNESAKVYFFTELTGLSGRTVKHVWERDGVVMAEVPFRVGGQRWRIFSSKNLEPSWTGEWTVKVMDESGNMLHQDSFSFVSITAQSQGGPTTPPASPAPME